VEIEVMHLPGMIRQPDQTDLGRRAIVRLRVTRC